MQSALVTHPYSFMKPVWSHISEVKEELKTTQMNFSVSSPKLQGHVFYLCYILVHSNNILFFLAADVLRSLSLR